MHVHDMTPPPDMMNPNEEGPIWVTEFDSKAAVEFCNALFRKAEQDPTKPILIYINSPGGEVSGMLSMISAMDAVPNKTITVSMGFAMSAGCFLLAHGDFRFASPYTRVMLHKIQGGFIGSLDDLQNETEEMSRLNEQMFGLFASDTGKSVEEITEAVKIKRELYFSATEAKDFGIIDVVGIPRVTPIIQPTQWQVDVITTAPSEEVPAPKPTKKKKKK
jgi:ATP-dependent Clp protease, protease subunit